MTIAQIASGIDAHLKRFEADPKINCRDQEWWAMGRFGLYDGAGACVSTTGPFPGADPGVVVIEWILIDYGSGSHFIEASEAERYLAWLDGGHIGKHWEALREKP